MLRHLSPISINKCHLNHRLTPQFTSQNQHRSRLSPLRNNREPTPNNSTTKTYQRKSQHYFYKLIQKKRIKKEKTPLQQSFNRRLITLDPEVQSFRSELKSGQRKTDKNRYFKASICNHTDQIIKEYQSYQSNIFTFYLKEQPFNRGKSLPITHGHTQRQFIMPSQSFRIYNYSQTPKKGKVSTLTSSAQKNKDYKLEGWSQNRSNLDYTELESFQMNSEFQ